MSIARWPALDVTKSSQRSAPASETLLNTIKQYLQRENVYDSMSQYITPLYLPMTNWLLTKHDDKRPFVVGINGAQGSGKSTLAGLLEIIFARDHGLKVARFSIDDLYLGKQERQVLSEQIHPLLATRGVPGTHDIELGLSLFDALSSGNQNTVCIPCFDKITDDRLPTTQWNKVTTPIDVILFEGWCVGATAQSNIQLNEPVNKLEAEEDPDRLWRTYVNDQLKGKYQTLFKQIDVLIMLKVPSMKQVVQWRGQQEQQLVNSARSRKNAYMNQKQLKRFIMHYERLTRYQLLEVDKRADVVLSLDRNHQVESIRLQEQTKTP